MFSPSTICDAAPSAMWRCDAGHHVGQCTCNLEAKFDKAASWKDHDEAMAYYVAYLDWFQRGTPDIDVTELLTTIQYHHNESLCLLLADIQSYDQLCKKVIDSTKKTHEVVEKTV